MNFVPKVSVVIPFYNVEKYLGECLESVVNQTLKDIEVICVNDGSTDSSPEIVLRYARSDPRVRLINKENGGVSSARNAGVCTAKGEYIYFLDSDDFIDLNAFEILYSEASKNNLDILFFDTVVIFENEKIEEKYQRKKYIKRSRDYNVITSGKEMLCNMIKNKDFSELVYLQFIKTEYYNEKQLFFYDGIIHEDVIFSFLSIIQASRVKHIGAKLHHRRYRESSIMTTPENGENFVGYMVSIAHIIKNCLSNEYDEDVMNAVRTLIKKYQRKATKIFINLPEEEKKSIKFQPWSHEQLFFDVLFENEYLKLRNSKTFKVMNFIHLLPKKVWRKV